LWKEWGKGGKMRWERECKGRGKIGKDERLEERREKEIGKKRGKKRGHERKNERGKRSEEKKRT
jgi:hypothetical protein